MRALKQADDPAFSARSRRRPPAQQNLLARCIRDQVGIGSIHGDVRRQIKRIHEYGASLLDILETVALPGHPQTACRLGAAGEDHGQQAAASYARAKLIIKLAHDVASVINSDPVVGDSSSSSSCRTIT